MSDLLGTSSYPIIGIGQLSVGILVLVFVLFLISLFRSFFKIRKEIYRLYDVYENNLSLNKACVGLINNSIDILAKYLRIDLDKLDIGYCYSSEELYKNIEVVYKIALDGNVDDDVTSGDSLEKAVANYIKGKDEFLSDYKALVTRNESFIGLIAFEMNRSNFLFLWNKYKLMSELEQSGSVSTNIM